MAASAPQLRRVGSAVGLTSAILPVIAVAAWFYASGRSPQPIDFEIFGRAGAHLLQGDLGSVYADPKNQGGPLELIPAGIAWLAGAQAPWGWAAFYLANIWLLLTGAALLLVHLLGPSGRRTSYIIMASGIASVLFAFLPDAVHWGHPAQAAIPLLWLGAAVCVRRGNAVGAAALVALSSGIETWGILGCGLVLAAPRRTWPLAALVGAAIVAALYVPFIATGHFAMLEYAWPVDRASLVGRLAPDLVRFPWGLRLVQAGLVVAAGSAVALLTRRIEDGIWMAPMAVVVVRLALDPLLTPYYWIEVGVVLGVVLALGFARRAWPVVALSATGLIVLRLAFEAATAG